MFGTKKRTSLVDKELIPSRTLDESELSTLREQLQDVLNIHPFNDTDHEDAEILLDYACDMIEEGDNAGHVIEELVFMEMSVCTESVGDKIGEILTNFFHSLDEPEEVEVVPPPQKAPTTPSWKKKLPIKEEEEK